MMMPISNIAVGVDRSPLAANALAWALDMAQEIGAEVTAIGTWEMPLICQLPGPIKGLPTPAHMKQQCAESLAKTCAEVAASHAGPKPAITEVVVEGKPGPALLDASSTSQLLVVGRTGYGKRHGLSRVAEIMLGSTARHCLHHSRIPVAAIPEEASWQSPPTAVVGVDGSPNSLAAVEWALTNLPANAQIDVLRAFEPWVGDGLVPQDLIGEDEVTRLALDETETWVGDLLEENTTARKAPHVEVAITTPQHALINRPEPADMTILGARGRSGVASFVLGSVADYLVRYCPGPVVVVPAPDTL